MISLFEIASILKKQNNFLILTHMHPDGDTIGSAFALCIVLQKIGKNAKVLCSDPFPKQFDFIYDYAKNQNFEPGYIIAVDVADKILIGENLNKYENKVDLCIDHHLLHKNFAKITYTEPSSASTAEIIYNLINEMEVEIEKDIAECLYVGVSTDTGCFRYTSTTARTHRIAAELIDKKINLSKINYELFEMKSKSLINIEHLIYDNIEYFFNGKCAISCVTLKMLEKANVKESELDGISSIPRRIEGVKIGITIREKSDGIHKASVRTVPSINAAEICRDFGGGGHTCAAGFSYNGSLEEIKEKLIKTIEGKTKWKT